MIIKKVITPVGTSIFENYMKQDKKDIDSLYEAITDKLSKEYNEKNKKDQNDKNNTKKSL